MKIRVETDGNYIYLADEHGKKISSISGRSIWSDDYSSLLEWMQAIIEDLDAPDQAKAEAAAHAEDLLTAWQRTDEMLAMETRAARLEKLEADMYIGGGYGEDSANAHAWDEINRLKREMNNGASD